MEKETITVTRGASLMAICLNEGVVTGVTEDGEEVDVKFEGEIGDNVALMAKETFK